MLRYVVVLLCRVRVVLQGAGKELHGGGLAGALPCPWSQLCPCALAGAVSDGACLPAPHAGMVAEAGALTALRLAPALNPSTLLSLQFSLEHPLSHSDS